VDKVIFIAWRISFARLDGARRSIEIARDTLQAAADQIEQRCEMMWWLV